MYSCLECEFGTDDRFFYLTNLLQSTAFNCSSPCASDPQALKEIARVSEELCSYQDEIRRKSVDKR